MKYAMAIMVVVMALTGGQAHAQVQPPQERINTALARARQVGIPVALLESKIAEGKAKGVSLDRIAVAIERRQAALERASQALRGGADMPSTLAVSADAIESGVSDTVLRALAENAPGDRRNVAIAALTELVQQGHTPEAALERVREALRRGPDALSNLPAEASKGRGRSGGSDSSNPGNGRGRARAGGDAAPPAAGPGPGKPPQAGRPDQESRGQGQGQGQGQGEGRGGSGPPNNPGRGGQ